MFLINVFAFEDKSTEFSNLPRSRETEVMGDTEILPSRSTSDTKLLSAPPIMFPSFPYQVTRQGLFVLSGARSGRQINGATRNALEMQTHRPQCRPTESEILAMGPGSLANPPGGSAACPSGTITALNQTLANESLGYFNIC